MPRASLWRRDRMNGRRTRGILQWLAFCSRQIGNTVSETVDGFAAVFLVCHGELFQFVSVTVWRAVDVMIKGQGIDNSELISFGDDAMN